MLPALEQRERFYPEEDGVPVGETGIHQRVIADVQAQLEELFIDREDVAVELNRFVYFREPTIPLGGMMVVKS